MRAPTVYLAGDFARRSELLTHAGELNERFGIITTSRWLTYTAVGAPEGGFGGGDANHVAATMAQMDLDDISEATAFMVFTTGELTRGGRQVETGYALALEKPVCLVGPRETVFHHLGAVDCVPNWLDAIDWLLNGLFG
jgi:nucleoside 2-deoxyribosyltransferase